MGIGPGFGQYNGRDGDDVNVSAAHGYFGSRAGTGGRGSLLYPASGLNSDQQFGINPQLGLAYCLSACAGGAGGGLYQPGQPGQALNVFSGTNPLPNAQSFFGPPSVAGTAFPLFPFPPAGGAQSSVDHFLVGGAGGGGSASNATLSLNLARNWASGAGGGGGGAMALRAGRAMILSSSGRLLAVGGSARDYVGTSAGGQVAPAGGGSGGSIVLQTGGYTELKGSIDVRGGAGGFFRRQGGNGIGPRNGIVEITGGDGGAGFVRLEHPYGSYLSQLSGMTPAASADNVGTLQEYDATTADQSKWYDVGSGSVIWEGYEADVDTDGDGAVDVTYGDSLQAGLQLASGPGLPLNLRFQAADITASGAIDPATIGPWRTAVGRGYSNTLAGGGGTRVRFRVVFDRSLFPQTVLRELRVSFQQQNVQTTYQAGQSTYQAGTATIASWSWTPPGLTEHQLSALPGGGALLFGGIRTNGGPFFATMEFRGMANGPAWTLQTPTLSPQPRTGHAMRLDEARSNNVMFGGADLVGGALGDTWTYANGQWSYLTPANAPSARSEHAICFDPITGKVVLLGGRDASGGALADMWEWDGTDWTARTPVSLPPARYGHALAFDRSRDRLVLFGGNDGANRLDDVWEWDGTDWQLVTPAQPGGVPLVPAGRNGHAMAFDAQSGRVVVIGGETDLGCTEEIWSWEGTQWTQHFPQIGTPPLAPRTGMACYADATSGALRLYGGACNGVPSDELLDIQFPVAARVESIGAGCPGSNGTPTLDVANGVLPIPGATLDLLYQNALQSPVVTPAVMLVGFQDDTFMGVPLPLPLDAVGLPGCVLYHSTDVSIPLVVAQGSAQGSWTLSIPNQAGLLGQEYFLQGAHLEFAPVGPWAALSNAIGLRVGTP